MIIRALLIEDDPDAAVFVDYLLQRCQPHLYFSLHSEQAITGALSYLAINSVDIILTDLSLPDASGTATLQQIKASAPNTPIVILSATEDDRTMKKLIDLGAQDHLIKGSFSGFDLACVILESISRHFQEEMCF